MRDYQLPIYLALWEAIRNPDCLKFVLNCARRFGKTTILCLIAIEFAYRKPGAQIRFAAPTAKSLRKIIMPIFKMLFADCPAEIRPKWKTQESYFSFHNGSEIHASGTDGGNAESLRGQFSHLNIVDEAGFADDLDYVLRSILMPQTVDTSGQEQHGTNLLASTPPVTPAHDFYGIAQEAKEAGFYEEFDIYSNTSLNQKTRDLYAAESGGYGSTTWLREYECKWVVSLDKQIVREWRDEYVQQPVYDDLSQFWHRYVAMDIGTIDFTALLFGYYNFKEARLYVVDELTLEGSLANSKTIYEEGLAKEKKNFGAIKPYRRISDNNDPDLLSDLGIIHNYHFIPTNKESLDAMVNDLRLMVQEGRVIVSPKCVKTIGCLKYGVWDEKHKQFARAKTYRHFDHLAALIYLVRNLDKSTNPVPAEFYYGPDRFINESIAGEEYKTQDQRQTAAALQTMIGFKRKK